MSYDEIIILLKEFDYDKNDKETLIMFLEYMLKELKK